MAVVQVPRLTTTLRAFNQHNSIVFDIDKMYLERKNILEEKRHTRVEFGSKSGDKLARKLISSWSSAPSQIRHAYEQFLKATAELLSGEMVSEELSESAWIIYDCLSDFDSAGSSSSLRLKLQIKREQLRGFFGLDFPDSSILRVAELAKELHSWHSNDVVADTPEDESTQDSVEFGANIDFQCPSVEVDLMKELLECRTDDVREAKSTSVLNQQVISSKTGKTFSKDIAGQTEANNTSALPFNHLNHHLSAGVSRVKMKEDGVSLRWLKEICDGTYSTGSGLELSGDELALAICRVLESDASGDEMAGHLFDLVGDSGFDVIQILLQHRKKLIEEVHRAVISAKSGKGNSALQHRMPSYGTQVSVRTDTEKQIDKLRRKEEKRQARHTFSGNSSELDDFVGSGGFATLLEASEAGNGLLDSVLGKGDLAGLSGSSLPKGASRKSYKGYEEVHVPATQTAPLLPGENLVQIACLDEFAQAAFDGYKTLNRIQSRIFHTAYNSNENLLVCAPTGAGKTNIAMITVLHEIGKHIKFGVLQKNEFKIVYIAPMKALAAEVTAAFGRRLAPLNVVVKELTGDMQLTKKELEETQMIVTTPEKWDVITRKTSDMALAVLVKLLIIDEVHLLNDDRGPVIEALVARTLRQVESSQSMIRIVGLSATLPNYLEVARFLHVNAERGLFYFDASYRPVPLTQEYIGITEPNFVQRNHLMNEICYRKILRAVTSGQQAMVFVHSRKDTAKTARILVEISKKNGEAGCFGCEDHLQYGLMKKEVLKSRNKELGELFQSGFGVHHAGMLRSDRNLTERLFSTGLLKVLVCTATLAWGVNLPAHMVVIKGTQLYDPKAGGWRELGMLDVMQIFGRAGRPQFDTSGEGIIITSHNKLSHYLQLMTHQLPIESQFISSLKDNLNAEVVLGTVTNLREACMWLGYTYLFVRMSSNPLVYGMSWEEVLTDPGLVAKRQALITDAARSLDKAKMIRFDEKSGSLYVTDLGRVASHFYLQYTSVETYNEMMRQHMNESELLNLVAHSSEFENIMVREEEQQELATLLSTCCPLEVRGGADDKYGKINILMQVYISRGSLEGFSLIADSAYISASLGRIMRALFEICLRRGWCSMASMLLEYCKAVDHRIWPHQHPLRQFDTILSPEVLYKLEERGADLDHLYDMDEKEIGAIIRHPHGGKLIAQCIRNFPAITISTNISPITRTVLQVSTTIFPTFEWKDRLHGSSLRWWIWVEDSENEHIYHSEVFALTKRTITEGELKLVFTIPIFEPLPAQYYVRAVSDSWLQSFSVHTISFQHLILPELHPPHTDLLDLRPLPVEALANKLYEELYNFSHFNPIQTQTFHALYHTDNNILLGAPTGSGKTISAEIAMFRLFNTQPHMKVVYIAPLKALVRERMDGWQHGLAASLGKRIVELTGDFTPDLMALLEADIIISTPEKWDGISRNWQNRLYVTKVGLIILDEIHLLGADRGPILEVIVSRMRYISTRTECPIRFVGLSTALANARDLADWLGIQDVGLFNFKPSVRPVPLEVHIQGYPGKHYCPRMNSMNKPTYAAIRTHAPAKPVLIFVSSRRQTRLTALDLIQYAAADEQPRQFLNISEEEMEMITSQVFDVNLRHTLQFGIGLHHAGLNDKDRSLSEELFLNNKIQVLVCTSTLAWGVNLPAHLVVIKGTEYFDGKTKRYIDYPITDVLQMMGRAGRPQFDQYGKAVILVHEPKKSFYKKFLYEPFPVESSLIGHLHDHLNAEIAAETLSTKQDAVAYLTWTYLFRRLAMNPSYYGLHGTDSDSINAFLSNLITTTLQDLEDAGCLMVNEDNTVQSLMSGSVASQYYLHYTTVALFTSNIGADTSFEALLHILAGASEYDELPVRHNEEKLNEALAKEVRLAVDNRLLDDPHVKTNLLLQAHFSRLELPISDYITDTKSVLDQSIRILQAMVDVAANGGWLKTTIQTMHILQMVMQGLWWEDSSILVLPHMDMTVVEVLKGYNILTLAQLLLHSNDDIRRMLQTTLSSSQLSDVMKVLSHLPRIDINWRFEKCAVSTGVPRALVVNLKRRNPKTNARAFAPRFPKMKEEGWWLVVGSLKTWELLVLKRISFADYLKTTLYLPTWLEIFEELTLFLVSDCYIGLDQQCSLSVI